MKTINYNTFLDYYFVSNPQISPDGNYTAFVLQKADRESNNYFGEIYLLCNENSQITRLTNDGKTSNYSWTKEGKILMKASSLEKYKIDKDDLRPFTVFNTINPLNNAEEEHFVISLNVGIPVEMGDNKYMLIADVDLNLPDFDNMNELEKKTSMKEYKDPICRVVEDFPFWANGAGLINRHRNTIYIYDAVTGEKKAVTEKFFTVNNANYESGKIVYTGVLFENLSTPLEGIYVYDPITGDNKCLVEQGRYEVGTAHMLDENTVITMLADMEDNTYKSGDFYLIDVKSGERTKIAEYDAYIGRGSVGSDARLGGGYGAKVADGKLYFISTWESDSHLFCIDASGKISKNLTIEGTVESFDIHDDMIMLCAMRKNKLNELYLLKDGQEIQKTFYNEFIEDEYKIITPEPISFIDSDGIEIHGWIMKPIDYIKGKKYPAILHIHGGPRVAFGSVFHNEMQLWASSGYFVFYCNPRGSDGKGEVFANLYGKYGSVDYIDLMEFTDECLKRYEDIDKKHIGVAGGSYGGFMVNWIIGHTNRFAVAVSQRSISNWISFDGTSDSGNYTNFCQHGASVAKSPEKLWSLSPLKYAHNAKTPTLFIHADEDYRCWMVEAFQMYSQLIQQGIESKIVLFHGENHELSRSGKPLSRIKRMKVILEWMDSHLK